MNCKNAKDVILTSKQKQGCHVIFLLTSFCRKSCQFHIYPEKSEAPKAATVFEASFFVQEDCMRGFQLARIFSTGEKKKCTMATHVMNLVISTLTPISDFSNKIIVYKSPTNSVI